MSNSNGVSSHSAVSSNGITNCFRAVHDGGYGLFKGMVTFALELVKPLAIKTEQAYVENYRWANTGGAAITGLGGLVCFYYAPWSCMWLVTTVVPSMYVEHRITQSCNTVQAESHTVNGELDVTAGAPSGQNSPATVSSLPAFSASGSHPPCLSNLPVTVRDTLPESGSEKIATKMMEGFGRLLKNTLDLVEAADDLAEKFSVDLIESIYKNNKRTCTPETKACHIAEARKALKTSFFITLLQASDKNTADTVYSDVLKTERNARFSRISESQNVDYEELSKVFHALAKESCTGSELLQTPSIQAILLKLFTRGWSVPDRPGSVAIKSMKTLLFADCQAVRSDFIREIEGACHLPADSAHRSLSAPVTGGRLRHRTRSRQDATS